LGVHELGTDVVRLHAVEPRSRANGPGVRYVIWFQGCNLGCPGCYNPDTHPDGAGTLRPIAEVVNDVEAHAEGIEGVSISGGEPLQQPDALLALVRRLRERTALSILVFSGYRRSEIEKMELGPEILAHIDVLIDGRYIDKQRLASKLRGSRNQSIQLLSGRYSEADVEATPAAEVKITASGEIVFTGVDPLRLDE